MIPADFVINAYARNLHFIKTYTEGFSQADSLIQPPAKANCANWIVGHIACYRNRLLDVLGQPPVIDPQLAVRYSNGSAPVLGEEVSIGQIDELKRAIEESQVIFAHALRSLTPEQSSAVKTYGTFSLSVAEWAVFLLRHEAMHQGQLELLQEVVKGSE